MDYSLELNRSRDEVMNAWDESAWSRMMHLSITSPSSDNKEIKKHIPSNIQDLPSEIQDLIFDYVICESTGDQLKLIRLSNKYFCDRADAFLFSTLHLSASTLSFERMYNVANEERLAQHVKTLVFHRGTFRGHSMASSMRGLSALPYGDFETYIIRSGVGLANMMRISALYDGFHSEVESEARFHRDLTWRSPMRRRFHDLFPKLEELRTCCAKDDIKSFYLVRKTGLTHQTWTPDHFAPYEILEAAGRSFRPKSLHLEDINGEDFWAAIDAIGDSKRVTDRFVRLTRLYLSFSETDPALKTEGPWTHFWQACTNLQDLRVDLSSFYSPKMWKEDDCFARRLCSLFSKMTYFDLQHLELTDCALTGKDLRGFLSIHASSLKHLIIRNWHAPPNSSSDADGPVLREIYQIGQIRFRRLQTVQLGGEFSKRYDGQGWTVVEPPNMTVDSSCVYNKIRLYILGLHDFPFDFGEKQLLKAKTEEDLFHYNQLMKNVSVGDASFYWHCQERTL